jgi:uncharacterized membrane protein
MDASVLFHTALSVLAILAGLFVVKGLLSTPASSAMTWAFIVLSILTSATGYVLPATTLLPSHIVGAVALVILAVVLVARYLKRSGAWRRIDALGLIASLYLLMFVLVAQAFAKVAVLHALAPTLAESPFAVAQGLVLLVFCWIGFRAVRRKAAIPSVALAR